MPRESARRPVESPAPRRFNAILPILGMVLVAALLAQPVASAQPTGTLGGTITVVGQTAVRDGEVVVSRAGSDEVVATANFSSSSLSYTIALPPGNYTGYATAPVHRASARVAFAIVAGGTTWLNLTIVRIEEVMGHVNSTKGGPVAGAVLQFSSGGSVRGGATSDSSGAFRTGIDPGSYDLTVTKAGFERVVQAVTVGAGQVVTLDLSMEPTGGGGDDAGFPTFAAVVILFVMFMLFGSFYYVGLQSRRIRIAAAEAEARRRAAGLTCPGCGADLAPGATKCPRCGFVLQVRCSDCGRLVDLKDAAKGECPECGAMLR